MSNDVVVIGAGLAGLAAACHLRGAGRSVTVIEAGAQPGGRAGILRQDGFTFDTGPTVLTMPELIEDCMRAVGASMSDALTLHRVDPLYRGCFADGSTIHVRSNRSAMTDEIRATCGAHDADAFAGFCEWLSELYALEMPNFIDRNFDSPLSLLRPLGPALRLVRSGGFRRLEAKVRQHFDDERLIRLFSFQSLYAGLAPQQALALYCVITYMDSINGVFRAEGGIHAVPRAMADAAVAAGVSIHYEQRVEGIELAGGASGAVRGVRLTSGERIAASDVVCTADLPVAYRTMLPGMPMPRRARTGHYSPSALVWHLGVRGALPSDAAHHNIHFGREWASSFEALLGRGEMMPDPSILVTVPTVDEPALAPAGAHTLYVLEPAPNLDGRVDWSSQRGRARERLLTMLDGAGYPTDIVTESFVDPRDWERQGMERGTPFALSHRFTQTGPFRPANVERRAPGLFFAGSGTVPGVGVPMVLISGKLAAQRVAARSGGS